jgi:hypothetical protein
MRTFRWDRLLGIGVVLLAISVICGIVVAFIYAPYFVGKLPPHYLFLPTGVNLDANGGNLLTPYYMTNINYWLKGSCEIISAVGFVTLCLITINWLTEPKTDGTK